jgi:NADH-quinone oxidoreductase subunit A
MFNLLIAPPVAFVIVLLAVLGLSIALSRLAFRPKAIPKGLAEPYACGEDLADQMVQPDYSQFFPFAFYFTILHVVALMAATVPVERLGTYLIAVVYVAGGIVGLFVLYRK